MTDLLAVMVDGSCPENQSTAPYGRISRWLAPRSGVRYMNRQQDGPVYCASCSWDQSSCIGGRRTFHVLSNGDAEPRLITTGVGLGTAVYRPRSAQIQQRRVYLLWLAWRHQQKLCRRLHLLGRSVTPDLCQ